jgi:hypothetical protein
MKKGIFLMIVIATVASAQLVNGKFAVLYAQEILGVVSAAMDSLAADYMETDTLVIGNGSVLVNSLGKISAHFYNVSTASVFSDTSKTSGVLFEPIYSYSEGEITSGAIALGLNSTWNVMDPDKWTLVYSDSTLVLQTGIAPPAVGKKIFEAMLATGNIDFPNGITAGTIEADNGWTGTWVNAESDTVHVVGGIIVDVVSP